MGVEVSLYPSPSDEKALKQLANARGSGLNITIKRGTLNPSDPSSVSAFCALRVKGRSDRLHVFVLGLKPVNPSAVSSWPAPVSFMLCAGLPCAIDVRKPISGPIPDSASFAAADEVRSGTLYHAANMLVGQWGLYAAVDPTASPNTEWQATLVIDADYLGGGGAVSVYKGGIFSP